MDPPPPGLAASMEGLTGTATVDLPGCTPCLRLDQSPQAGAHRATEVHLRSVCVLWNDLIHGVNAQRVRPAHPRHPRPDRARRKWTAVNFSTRADPFAS